LTYPQVNQSRISSWFVCKLSSHLPLWPVWKFAASLMLLRRQCYKLYGSI